MKKRMLFIIPAVITIILLGLLITFQTELAQLKIRIFPSAEMKRLMGIETSLHLAPPVNRYLNDDGEYIDWKGAHQYQRSICNYYNDYSFLSVEAVLLQNSWLKSSEREFQGDKIFHYQNVKVRSDIYGTSIVIEKKSQEFATPHMLEMQHAICIYSEIL